MENQKSELTEVRGYFSFYNGESFLLYHCQKCQKAWKYIEGSVFASKRCTSCYLDLFCNYPIKLTEKVENEQ